MDRNIVTTHPNFKSLVRRVTNTHIINSYIGYALDYQNMFIRRTTPWERSDWGDDELNNFLVDLGKVDRLYHIGFDEYERGLEFEFVGRMIHNGKHLYIEMTADCCFTGFSCSGEGKIFMSKDVNLFLKTIPLHEMDMTRVYNSLQEDGIEFEVAEDGRMMKRFLRNNAPTLKYLCHESIFEHRHLLKNYKKQLPKILKDSVKEFIKTRESRICYEYDMDLDLDSDSDSVASSESVGKDLDSNL